jgi:hypothetical protein
VVAVQASDEIVQLAAQGNLQALSVYLNRHVIPSGAHVKVKSKANTLHILVVFMRAMDDHKLLDSLKDILLQLNPAQVECIKLYSQVLGKNQPTLRDEFFLGIARAEQANGAMAKPASLIPEKHKPDLKQPTTILQVPAAQSSQPTGTQRAEQRFSIAEYLSQITTLDELQVLQKHPFFTGVCPHCQYSFQELTTPPLYWDCSQCGWKDDLSTMIPKHQLREKQKSTYYQESKRLGDYLVEAGLLTQTQIEVALEDQQNTGMRLGEVLAHRGWVKEETIEYLMQKIILPERSGAHLNAASYLESSRNLLKTLLTQNPSTALNSQSRSVPTSSAENPSISSPTPQPKAPLSQQQKGRLAHERDTLILPDLDLDDLL